MTVSISSGSLSPDEVARKTFAAARRGVDADAVRKYLEAVAAEMRAGSEREQTLKRRLADAERRAAEPELDQATLTKAVGTETARILQTAHEAAAGVLAKAEQRASDLVTDAEETSSRRRNAAEEEAAALLARAELSAGELTSTAETEVAKLREDAGIETVALTEAAQHEAVQLLDSTKAECRQMIREARELRAAVLGDLSERRRALYVQLEQLRSGRDSLVEMVNELGGVVDELRERLAGAEHEARLAAAEAGERAMHFEEPGEAEVELTDDEETREAETAASYRSVDELFARIRSAREAEAEPEPAPEAVPADSAPPEPVTEAEAVPADPPLPEPVTEAEAAPAPEAVPPDTPSPGSEPAPDAGDNGEPQGVAEEPEVTAQLAVVGAEQAVPAAAEPEGVDAAALARRTQLLAPLTARLARALKRALQDDQNELLTALRSSVGPPDLARLLPEDDQQARYAVATTQLLAEVFELGQTWLAGSGETGNGVAGQGNGQSPAEEDSFGAANASTELASALATELSGLLRHKVSESFAALDDSTDGAASDAASGAYREWKGPRVEALAGDFTTRAFGWGAVAGGRGTSVRWVSDDDGTPCSDCDDNALAGEQPAGEPFPTGQVHPPAHPGCRCLLVATS